MISDDHDRDPVADALRTLPPARVSDGFLARVNARIDETAGWLGLADFRAWTLGLVPAAIALVLLAIFWPASTATQATSQPAVTAASFPQSMSEFSPTSSADWQRDVTANALLDAALHARATDRPRDVR